MNKYLVNIWGQISVIKSNSDVSCVRRKKNQRNEKRSWRVALNTTAKKEKHWKMHTLKRDDWEKKLSMKLAIYPWNISLSSLRNFQNTCVAFNIFIITSFTFTKEVEKEITTNTKKNHKKKIIATDLFLTWLYRWKDSLKSKLCCSIISLQPHIW